MFLDKAIHFTPSDLSMQSKKEDSILLPYISGELSEDLDSAIWLEACGMAYPEGEESANVEDCNIQDLSICLDPLASPAHRENAVINCTVDLVNSTAPANRTVQVSLPVALDNKEDLLNAFTAGGCKGLNRERASIYAEVYGTI